MKKLGVFTVRTIDYVFFGLIAIILLSAIVSFSEMITNGVFKYAIILISIAIVAIFVVFGYKILRALYKIRDYIKKVSAFRLGLILFFIVLLTKVFFVFLFDNDADKTIDMRLYRSFAAQLANSGQITENTFPALMYKYQVIYGLFLSPVIKLFGNDTKVLTCYLSLLFAVLSVLLFDIIKKYVGKNKAFSGILLFNLLPVGLFETQLLVHETPLLFFYITSFWLLTKSFESKYNLFLRLGAVLLSAILIGFGNKINQGGTVVIISYCIYVVVITVKDKINIKSILRCLYTLACYLICFILISNICTSFVTSVVKPSKEDAVKMERSVKYDIPFGWGLYLGTNIEHAGHWNAADRETYEKYVEFNNKQDAQDYLKGIIDERLQAFKDNPLIIPGHLFNKIKGLWGSPQLPFAYEEGNSINEFVLKGAHGIINKLITVLSYWVFILLCCLILFSHKRHKNIDVDSSFYTPVSQFKMIIIGLTAVLFLFEVMPKYVCHMQIIMFSIGIFSFDNFMENSKRIRQKISVRKKDKV